MRIGSWGSERLEVGNSRATRKCDPVHYPAAPRGEVIDVLHGVAVSDPFRSLEQADDSSTRAWIDEQNALTRAYLDGPLRDDVIMGLTKAYDVPRTSGLVRRRNRYFFSRNPGLEPQPTIFVQDGPLGTPRPLIEPSTLSSDGTAALTAMEPSHDGSLVAYAISVGGSDRQEIRIRDVESGIDLPDRLHYVKFASIAWGSNGFYYLRFPAPGSVTPEDEQYFGRICFHRVGDPQSADALVFQTPHQKEVVPLVDAADEGRLIVITAQRGASDNSEVYLLDPTSPDEPRPVFTGFDAAYHFVDGIGDRLFFRTTRGAPLGRVISVLASDPLRGPIEVIAEQADRISNAALARDTLVLSYLHNASDTIRLFDVNGHERGRIALPGIGSILDMDAHPDSNEVLLSFTSFTEPPAGYRCELPGLLVALAGAEHRSAGELETTQVWYASKDGTRVSMFLVHRLGLVRDGNRPVVLSGYGGFNVSRTPSFDPGIVPFLDSGGVFALANLRGGGEYGEEWHRAGMLDRKQNTFDDFIAAAEYLISEGFTQPARLAIEGGSNGGLLVAAVMLQRPDLFGAVVCRVPVADMLRYHRFTIGRFWIPEYGCADDPEQFPWLLAYSPYHNVRRGETLPPVLVMTADSDDRVDPGMARKFAARLQADATGGPFLLRVEQRAGHGAGKPVGKLIDEDADILAFLARTLTAAPHLHRGAA